MRNPNGYGSVINLGKHRRKPYAVRLTLGFELDLSDGKPKATQKYKYIGYYSTRKEAVIALAQFNANPCDLANRDITFAEVFNIWFASRFSSLTDDEKKPAVYYSYSAAFKKCAPIHSMRLVDIKTAHIRQLLTPDMSKSTMNNIIVVCNFVFEYGIQNDIIQKNYVQYVDIPKAKATNVHKPFTQSEISLLWQHTDNATARLALMLIYSGLRIGEFISLKIEDIDIGKKCIHIRKAKTNAGIRVVPIADKTLPFWQSYTPSQRSGAALRSLWAEDMAALGLTHLFHDARHTCVSLLTAAEVPLPIIQKIVGHSGKSVTENVYMHLELPTLLTAINKI